MVEWKEEKERRQMTTYKTRAREDGEVATLVRGFGYRFREEMPLDEIQPRVMMVLIERMRLAECALHGTAKTADPPDDRAA